MSRRHFVRFWALLLAFGLSLSSAKAQKTIHVPGDQPYIQAAINAASNGDTVLVSPGTYKEDITFLGKAITLTSSGGAAQTIIDGGEAGPVVSFTNGETRSSVLNGFTITDDGPPLPTPVSGDAAGIRVGKTNPADPTITNNIITQNRGFGIEIEIGGPLIQGNTISYTVTAGDPGQDYGCDFDDGSGIQLFTISSTEPAEVIGNIIENNKAQCRGGGIQAGYIFGPAPIIQNNIIRNNVSLGEGAAISLINGGQMEILQNLIFNNNSGAAGGALYFLIPSGANFNSGPVNFFIVNNTIAGNTLTPNPLLIDDYMDGSQIGFGGYVSQTGIYNNIIVANDSYAAIACYPVYSYLSATPPLEDHNDIVNSGGPRAGGWCPDQNGSNGNISADPMFANAANGDFHLQTGSPAIDSGDNSAPNLLSTDVAGSVRIQNGMGLPYPVIDLGAYEAAGPANLQTTQTSLTAQPPQVLYGAAINFQAAVTAPDSITSGSVGFFDGTTLLGKSTPSMGGAASFSSSQLSAGTHEITAAFSGTSALAGSVSTPTSVVVTGEPTSTALTYSPAQPTYPQTLVMTATVQSSTGTPTGSVMFYMGDEPMGTAPLNAQGVASYTFSNLNFGQYTFYAYYPIQGAFDTSTSPTVSIYIQRIPTTISLSASPNPAVANQAVTISATVQSATLTPTGFVIFDDGSTGMGTANLNSGGEASFGDSNLTVGPHSITGTYISQDGNFLQSTSQPLSLTISNVPPDFSVADSPGSLSLNAGQSGTSNLTISPVSNYTGSIALSCSGLPSNAACSFSPSSTLSATGNNGNLTTTLTVNVAAKTVAPRIDKRPPRWPAAGLPAAAWCLLTGIAFMACFGVRRRPKYAWPGATCLGILCAIALASCGGGSSGGGGSTSPPAPITTNYTLVITATGTSNSGTTTHAVNLAVAITE